MARRKDGRPRSLPQPIPATMAGTAWVGDYADPVSIYMSEGLSPEMPVPHADPVTEYARKG